MEESKRWQLKGACLGVLFFLCATNLSLGGPWPSWRGPGGDGVARGQGFPLHWNTSSNVTWNIPLPDAGNGSPIVWEDQVFITQSLPREKRVVIMSFDRSTGNLRWQSALDKTEQEETHRANPYASASPVTDGERVIAWFGSEGVLAVDMEGKELWRKDLGTQRHTWGYASSPVIHGDHVFLYFGPGEPRILYALNKTTGEVAWSQKAPAIVTEGRTDGFRGSEPGISGSFSTPLLIEESGRDSLVMSFANQLHAYNPENGKTRWYVEGLNPLVYTSPIYGEGVVVAMGGFSGTTMAVEAGGEGEVTGSHLLWKEQRTRDRLGSGVIRDGYIYVLNTPGIAERLELRTGKQVWEKRVQGDGPTGSSWSSMVLVEDRIYVLNQSSETVVLRASPEFELLAVNPLNNKLTNASLAASDGQFFIRTHERLWCIGQRQ